MSAPEFRELLIAHFSLEELKSLCDDLDIDHEEIAGPTKPAKARELIEYCQRHNKATGLHQRCVALRPRVAWPALGDANAHRPTVAPAMPPPIAPRGSATSALPGRLALRGGAAADGQSADFWPRGCIR